MKKEITKKVSVIALLILFLIVAVLHYTVRGFDASNIILVLTALIIFWYTYETYELKRISQEQLDKSKKPVVGYEIANNPDNPLDTRFILQNLSDYPLSARVKCNFKIDGEEVKDVWKAYDGKEYWNLQYKEQMEGHFCWYEIYNKVLYAEDGEEAQRENLKELKNNTPDEIKKQLIRKLILTYDFDNPPKFTMDLEIFCENRVGKPTYYPPRRYEMKVNKCRWVPILTTEKPFWEYDNKPSWIG